MMWLHILNNFNYVLITIKAPGTALAAATVSTPRKGKDKRLVQIRTAAQCDSPLDFQFSFIVLLPLMLILSLGRKYPLVARTEKTS